MSDEKTNRVIDHAGQLFGYLVQGVDLPTHIVRPDGRFVRTVPTPDGAYQFLYLNGDPAEPLNPESAPLRLTLDERGHPLSLDEI